MECPHCKGAMDGGVAVCPLCGATVGTPQPAPAMAGPADIGSQFTAATDIWKKNLSDLIVLSLVFILVAWIPIANIGFIAGYTRSLLKVARGQGRAQVGDVFSAWDCFGNLLVYCLLTIIAFGLLHFVPFVGTLAAMVLGFVVVPGFYAIIDNKRQAIDAFKWSIETIQAHVAGWLLAYLVGTVIACAGSIVLFIGIIVTLAWGQLIIIQQYEQVKPA